MVTIVEWIEETKDVTPPEKYKSNPTKEDYDAYYEAVEKAKLKHEGIILSFQKRFGGDVKAVIAGDDNKIYTKYTQYLTIKEIREKLWIE